MSGLLQDEFNSIIKKQVKQQIDVSRTCTCVRFGTKYKLYFGGEEAVELFVGSGIQSLYADYLEERDMHDICYTSDDKGDIKGD